MIVEHVIRNAQDATPEDGSVKLIVGVGAPSVRPRAADPSTASAGGGAAQAAGPDGGSAGAETSRLLRVPHAFTTASPL